MSRRQPHLNPFYRLVAVFGVALVLTLAVLSVTPSLHAWLHGEKYLDADDDCAVVLFAQGITSALAAAIVVAVSLRVLPEKIPAPSGPVLAPLRFQFPPGRGPPLN